MDDHNNRVELVGHYGGDEAHALAAWTSTSRDLSEEKRGRIDKLLKQLAVEGHHTPFERSTLHFLCVVDCATHIQILKHRIGVSFNGESARYKELKDDKYYIPVDWDDEERERLIVHLERSLEEYHDTLDRLVKKGLSRKRAKESARFYLPYANQITADVMFNFRSFYHFLKLRYSTHAQLEIRELAKMMLNEASKLPEFSLTLRAFGLVNDDGTICEPFG